MKFYILYVITTAWFLLISNKELPNKWTKGTWGIIILLTLVPGLAYAGLILFLMGKKQ